VRPLTAVSINSAKVGSAALSVTLAVVTSAQTGMLNFGGQFGGPEWRRDAGTVQLSFASSTKAPAIVAAVNQFTDSTDVSATLSGNAIKFTSSGYGASQFLTVSSNNSTALTTQDTNGIVAATDYGRNATLTGRRCSPSHNDQGAPDGIP
jgi:hypothetical protein